MKEKKEMKKQKKATAFEAIERLARENERQKILIEQLEKRTEELQKEIDELKNAPAE